ncbi:MAG TPA: DNA adenine methylase, partial [Spirochaetia bacterium]|nr:DNA adenine methylase [Spirochaetia bacterium]
METRQAGNMATLVPRGLTHGLISYIGNKRRMLEPLAEVFAPLLRDSGETTFLDPFSGSGAVSRLAKHLGFRVHAADWEPYAAVVTAASLENDP